MDSHYSAEATLLFDNHQISRQMTYSEFEAVLDAYVPLAELAGRTMQAVYLRINTHLDVVAAVFFLVGFDKQGFADSRWNVPLEQLADTRAKGPDMGSGPIRLACFSQCPAEWQQKYLWDPDMDAHCNNFVQIKKAIKNNELGFSFHEDDELREGANPETQSQNQAANSHFDEERTRAALLIKEQRLKYKLIVNKAEQDKRQLRLDHQEQLLSYQQQLHQIEKQYADSLEQVAALSDELSLLEQKNDGIRDYYENKINSAPSVDQNELDALRDHYESEMLLRTEAAVTELQGELETKNVEILYRKEKEQQLQQEILSLQKDGEILRNTAASDDTLTQLTEAGINFVVYHPGAGHLSIAQIELNDYLNNTVSYVAKQCGVNEQLYRIWLTHFYKPVCQHDVDAHIKCNQEVTRVDDPSQFVVGSSDRCLDHRIMTPTVVNISKNGRRNNPSGNGD